MLGDASPEQLEALWDYGLNIGMAFQLVDDLLDFTGEEQTLGKPVGGDLQEGKMTLPVIHLIEEWRELRTMLAQARSTDYAQRIAGEFVDQAKRALYAFPASEARDALMYLPDYVVARDR